MLIIAASTLVVLLGTGNPGPIPERSGPATAIVVDDVAREAAHRVRDVPLLLNVGDQRFRERCIFVAAETSVDHPDRLQHVAVPVDLDVRGVGDPRVGRGTAEIEIVVIGERLVLGREAVENNLAWRPSVASS